MPGASPPGSADTHKLPGVVIPLDDVSCAQPEAPPIVAVTFAGLVVESTATHCDKPPDAELPPASKFNTPGLTSNALVPGGTMTGRVKDPVTISPSVLVTVALESLEETIDPAPYEHKRNVLCNALAAIGYEVRRPEGAFYVFLKTPIADDIAFSKRLAEEGVLAVPGSGFGRSGYIRLSLTIPLEQIMRSVGGFERAFLAVAR